MLRTSRRHLAEAGENYFEHLRFASLVSVMLIGAGLACIVHALVPALCERTASRTVHELTRLFQQRDRIAETATEVSGSLVLVGLTVLAAACAGPIALAGHSPLTWPMIALVGAVPLAYLLSNPNLDPVTA